MPLRHRVPLIPESSTHHRRSDPIDVGFTRYRLCYRVTASLVIFSLIMEADMSLKRQWLRVAAGAAVAGLLVSACSDSGNDSKSDGSSITVSMISWGGSVPENDVVGPAIKAATGVDVKLSGVASQQDYYAQLGAHLAAGTASDYIQVDRAHLQQYVTQGLLLDVTDYLKTELADYSELLSETGFALGTLDGRVYGLPKLPSAGPYDTYWIRQDWLDKLGLSIPKNINDFAEVLRAFTKDDPDGNGRADTYGLTGGGMDAFTPIWGAFGTGFPEGFYKQDGQIVSGYAAGGTPEALAYINGLVNAKVTDPDVLTLNKEQALDRALQGKAGVVRHTFSGLRTQLSKVGAEIGGEWVQMLGPSGPAGGPSVPFDRHSGPMFAIPASVGKDPAKRKAIFTVLNYLSTEKGQRLVAFGIEGTDWELVDGKPQITDAASKTTPDKRGFTWMYQLTGRDDSGYLKRGGTPYAAEEVDFALNQPILRNYRGLVTAPEEFNAADANRFAEENLVQFVSGKRPMGQYDDFLKMLYGQFGYQKFADTAAEQIKTLTD